MSKSTLTLKKAWFLFEFFSFSWIQWTVLVVFFGHHNNPHPSSHPKTLVFWRMLGAQERRPSWEDMVGLFQRNQQKKSDERLPARLPMIFWCGWKFLGGFGTSLMFGSLKGVFVYLTRWWFQIVFISIWGRFPF